MFSRTQMPSFEITCMKDIYHDGLDTGTESVFRR